MANRLRDAASVYLRQHADNPVDWWPWGAAAFAEAHERDLPILLSVGYASCHWCHVMAHESFEDEQVAAFVNGHFVPVKVDREEHPDVDAIYMSATQALTGQGGWPMTCFLTPDGEPFYAGTYFPPRPAHGLPSFTQLITAIADAWQTKRDRLTESAGRIAAQLAATTGSLGAGPLGPAQLDAAATALLGELDTMNGGFGGAPKFPPAMACEFLLRYHERTGSVEALQAVTATLRAMARGGIFDQLGGGFARYSVDAQWRVPHFEKMLDDNALLLALYSHHARLTGSDESAAVAQRVADFLLTGLRTPDGVFAAALDADTAGVEGATYRWTPAQIEQVLGADEAATAMAVFGIDPARPDPEGDVLRLAADPVDPDRFAAVGARLLQARSARQQPGRDDVVVLRSNGLAIAALAQAGAELDHREWVGAASVAADHLAAVHRMDGRWYRSSLHGVVGPSVAVLADYADLAAGLLALYQAAGDPARLTTASSILEEMLDQFAAPDGSLFDTRDGAGSGGPMILRPKDPTDGAAPSGASSSADALLTAAALTGSDRFRAAAESIAGASADLARRFPRSAGRHLAVAEALLAGPVQVAVSGPAGPDRDVLARQARRGIHGGGVVDVGEPDAIGRPLLAGRPLVGGAAAAYVCRGFVCDIPVTEPAELAAQLAR